MIEYLYKLFAKINTLKAILCPPLNLHKAHLGIQHQILDHSNIRIQRQSGAPSPFCDVLSILHQYSSIPATLRLWINDHIINSKVLGVFLLVKDKCAYNILVA